MVAILLNLVHKTRILKESGFNFILWSIPIHNYLQSIRYYRIQVGASNLSGSEIKPFCKSPNFHEKRYVKVGLTWPSGDFFWPIKANKGS